MEISGTRLVVPTRLEELPGEARRVVAGVSAFGSGAPTLMLCSARMSTRSGPASGSSRTGRSACGRGGAASLHEDTHFAAKVDEPDPGSLIRGRGSLRPALDGSAELGIGTIQPALFGFQLAAASMLEATQGAPSAVIGPLHGEVAAAVVAGILTQEQGQESLQNDRVRFSELPPI